METTIKLIKKRNKIINQHYVQKGQNGLELIPTVDLNYVNNQIEDAKNFDDNPIGSWVNTTVIPIATNVYKPIGTFLRKIEQDNRAEDTGESYNSAFSGISKNKYLTTQAPERKDYVTGLNLMANAMKKDPEFKDFSDEDINILVQGAFKAANLETNFSGDNSKAKTAITRAMADIAQNSPTFIQRVGGAVDDGENPIDIVNTPVYDFDLSKFYNGNALSREALKDIRRRGRLSGPSLGFSNIKGAFSVVPIRFQERPGEETRSQSTQDAINTMYVLSKLYRVLKDKHLYFTNDILTQDQVDKFAADPENTVLTRGPEMTIFEKLGATWVGGGILSNSEGQTAFTHIDENPEITHSTLTKDEKEAKKRQANYMNYMFNWQKPLGIDNSKRERELMKPMSVQDKVNQYTQNLHIIGQRKKNAEKAAAYSQAVDARLWQKNNIGMPVYNNPYLGLTDKEKEVLKYQAEHPFTTPSEEYKALQTRINNILYPTTIYNDASRYTHANGGTLHLQYFR